MPGRAVGLSVPECAVYDDVLPSDRAAYASEHAPPRPIFGSRSRLPSLAVSTEGRPPERRSGARNFRNRQMKWAQERRKALAKRPQPAVRRPESRAIPQIRFSDSGWQTIGRAAMQHQIPAGELVRADALALAEDRPDALPDAFERRFLARGRRGDAGGRSRPCRGRLRRRVQGRNATARRARGRWTGCAATRALPGLPTKTAARSGHGVGRIKFPCVA